MLNVDHRDDRTPQHGRMRAKLSAAIEKMSLAEARGPSQTLPNEAGVFFNPQPLRRLRKLHIQETLARRPRMDTHLNHNA
jgi:hypothetical protein